MSDRSHSSSDSGDEAEGASASYIYSGQPRETTFAEQLIAGRGPEIESSTPRYLASPRSIDSSLEVMHSRSGTPSLPASSAVPSLLLGSSTTGTSVAATDRAKASRVLVRAGLIDVDGNALNFDRLPCEFKQVCDCDKTFECSNFPEWYLHCRSHFENHKPPRRVSCPFHGCLWSKDYDDGETAWEKRGAHMYEQHFSQAVNERDFSTRLCAHLLRHLWRLRIINDTQQHILMAPGRSQAQPDIWIARHGGSLDIRREGRQRPLYRT